MNPLANSSVLLCVAVASLSASDVRFSGDCDWIPRDQIAGHIDGEVRLNALPGIAVVVAGAKGACTAVTGVKDTIGLQPMQVDTPVDVASVSKSFTAAALWQLWLQGRFDLDAPASRYLPEFRGSDLAAVTIRQFVQHRSGLSRSGNFLAPYSSATRDPALSTALERLRQAQPRWAPGTMFRYTNSNYVVLAALVERLSGQPFPAYMRDRVFGPLGMERTTIGYKEAVGWGLAVPHEWQWGEVRPSPPRFFGWYGASLVKSTAEDMGRYLQAWLGRDFARSVVPGQGWWAQNSTTGYDWGWFIRRQAAWLENKLVLEHSGDIWGSNAAVVLAPENGVGAAVLINMGAERALYIARSVVALTVGGRPEAPRPAPLTGRPDFWAMMFVGASGLMLVAVATLTLRAVAQVRAGRRALRNDSLRVTRALLLTSLAAILVVLLVSSFTPPLEVFPATIQVALPVLVVAVASVLVCAGLLGLFPKSQPNYREG